MRINGLDLHVEDTLTGTGTVVLSHGLLWSTRMFEAQIAGLRDRWRVVAYDHRGQGRSEVPPDDTISMEDCYADAVALVEALGVGPVHFVGLSMGGFVAMRLAARRPELVRSISLLESAADTEPAQNHRRYGVMNFIARMGGIRLVASSVMPIMFGKTFLADPARAAERTRWRDELTANKPTIYRAVNGVVRRAGVEDELARIAVPTLFLHGEEDVAVSSDRARATAARIPGSRFVPIPRAGHSSTVEEPEAITRALREFLEGLEG